MEPEIFRAVRGYDTELLKKLLISGVNPNLQNDKKYTPLVYAAKYFNTPASSLLLNYKADPNVRDKHGNTLLSYSIGQYNYLGGSYHDTFLTLIKQLLEHGANPNIANNVTVNPLHLAAYYGITPIVQLLLEFRADPRIRDNDGKTSYDYALERGHLETVDLIFNYGLNWTPLTHLQLTLPEHRQQIQTLMHIRQFEDTPLATLSPELMYQIFPHLTRRY